MVVTRSHRVFGKRASRVARRMPWRTYSIVDEGAKQYLHDFVAIEIDENDTTTIQLHTLRSSGLSGTDVCPITQESFLEISNDQDEEAPVFYVKKPSLCIGRLPCGHHFSLMAIVKNFVLSSMRCPVCRHGIDYKAGLRSVPSHLRQELQQIRARARQEQLDEERQQLQEAQESFWREDLPDIQIAMGWDGPGFAVTPPFLPGQGSPEVRIVQILVTSRMSWLEGPS